MVLKFDRSFADTQNRMVKFSDYADSSGMARNAGLSLILAVGVCLHGCASVPAGGAAPPAPTPLPAAEDGTTNVVVPQTLAVNIQKTGFSIPELVGIPYIKQGICEIAGGFLRFGQILFPTLATGFPQLEPGNPIVALNDPANLESDSPAIQSAAKIKQDEDQAQQKIKAINYLATIGCGGCYPDVEDAFLAALDDCTESVRFAAVSGLKEAAGNPCSYCSHKSCCSPKIRKKLAEMTQQGDCLDCAGEPSERVRRVARSALFNCGIKGLAAIPDETIPEEIEGPTRVPEPAAPKPMDDPTVSEDSMPVTGVQPTDAILLVSHEVESDAVDVAANFIESNQPDLEKLAAVWLGEMDPKLPLEMKREQLRLKTRAFLKARREQEVLMADILHEVKVDQKLQSIHASPVTPVLRRPLKIESQTAIPIRRATISPRTDIELQSFQGTNSINKHTPLSTDAPSNLGGVEVRWEVVSWRGNSKVLRPMAREEMERLRRSLEQKTSVSGNAEFRRQLEIATHEWTTITSVTDADIQQALASLAVGEISEVLETEAGFEIVRVLQRRSKPE